MRLVTDPLLTIGAFARAVGLSASALRYYDECGLLTPAEVDDTTGYRYYTPALSQQARLVAQLRELGVPIHVMKQVVTGSPEQGRAALRDLVNAQQATTERVSSIVGEVLAELDRTPVLTGPTRATVSGPQLAAALRQVRPARAKGASTPLGCVVIDVDEQGLDVVATNRHWMAVRTLNVVSSGSPTRCVLGAADAAELAGRLDACTEVDLEVTENRLTAAGGCWAGRRPGLPGAPVVPCWRRASGHAVRAATGRPHGRGRVRPTLRCDCHGGRAPLPGVPAGSGPSRRGSGYRLRSFGGDALVQHSGAAVDGLHPGPGGGVGDDVTPIGPLRISSPYQPGFLALLMPRCEE